MPKCDFNKVAKQLYWNHTSAWVFSYKFVAYFQNTVFLRTHLKGCFCILIFSKVHFVCDWLLDKYFSMALSINLTINGYVKYFFFTYIFDCNIFTRKIWQDKLESKSQEVAFIWIENYIFFHETTLILSKNHTSFVWLQCKHFYEI